MICEHCKKQNATVRVQITRNNHKNESFLCKDCANASRDNISTGQLLKGVMNKSPNVKVTITPKFYNNSPNIEIIHQDENIQKCPACGLDSNQLQNTGKLGCINCFYNFKNQIIEAIDSIQGRNIHCGKFPKKYSVEILNSRKIEQLKAEIQKAITCEDYETAAQIRDEVKKLKLDEEQATEKGYFNER